MAITGTEKVMEPMGNVVLGMYLLLGDGSGTTYDLPVSTVIGAWFQRVDDTETSELLSWSGNTLTFGAAPANGKYVSVGFLAYV